MLGWYHAFRNAFRVNYPPKYMLSHSLKWILVFIKFESIMKVNSL